MLRAVQRDLAFQKICEIKQYESHISRKCGLINPNKINETKVAQRNAILTFFPHWKLSANLKNTLMHVNPSRACFLVKYNHDLLLLKCVWNKNLPQMFMHGCIVKTASNYLLRKTFNLFHNALISQVWHHITLHLKMKYFIM